MNSYYTHGKVSVNHFVYNYTKILSYVFSFFSGWSYSLFRGTHDLLLPECLCRFILYSTSWRAANTTYMEKAQRFTFSTSRRAAGSSLSGIGLPALLFHVLEGGKVFFAGADFDDVENVIDKNLSISDVAGVECFAGGLDDFVHGNSGHDDFDLDLGQ